ncbi:endocuticle structural glycoprotein SgAbd-9 [Drosophila ficusphila]|uniref:endocuticle structural glycoprotein SgAbd-9 n=1 Tax=Drosophila ficusphila TaxID=30025 RepID=UPI0007E6C892|nr:endocuticle structural glycoprotein SgAbd-9 [Drosophila ficusphila]
MATSGLILLSIFLLSAIITSAQQIKESEKEKESERSVRLLDRFDNRYPDGSYEYRFELDDGTARYERGYFVKINEVKTLIVVGYYSYRMTDGRYITVFYNADQFGYRQNQSITPQVYPNLPRSIEVPLASELSSAESDTNLLTQTQTQYQSQSRLESHGVPAITTTTPRGAGTNRRGRY